MAWTIMEKRGWKSRDTLNKARKELLNVELIIVARYGDRKRPHLYALTFFAIDECQGKLDVKSTERPPSYWRLHEPVPPIKIKVTTPHSVLNVVDMTRPVCDLGCDIDRYDTPPVLNESVMEIL